MSIKKVMDVLKIYTNFLISTHINPEGDALGSQLALAQLLEGMGRTAVMVNDHKVPSVYKFLPKSDSIRTRVDKTIDYDVAIVVDCPNLERIGRVRDALKEGKMILNIDHHISNGKFGKVNWVNDKASSCGEMIYELLKELDCKLNKEIATNLYTAIMTDTGSFSYSNTTAKVHKITSELVGCGLDAAGIKSEIYDKKGIGEIRLLGEALSTIQTDSDGKIAYLTATRDMAKSEDGELRGTEEFVNFPRSIGGVEIALFFREEKGGNIHVSLRSNSGLDVNKVAVLLGGGGHAKAAGCIIKGKMDEVKERVLTEVRKEVAG